nr:MAG TPA: Lysozyme [Caudoviricetes sp.]
MKLSQRGMEMFEITDAVDISPYITTETTQSQFDALTSLATDIGIESFRKSMLLKKHNLRCFSCAVAHFIVWGEKTGNKAKRKAEKEVYWYGY